MANEPKPRIICEPEDAALPDRLRDLSKRIGVPVRVVIEAVLVRSSDSQLATHARLFQAARTRLEAVD